METVYGISNWKLTVCRKSDHVEILRAVTCDSRAVLPDELFSLPVTVLGDHALAPGASPVAGEEVTIVCGRPGQWDNRALKDLTLPSCLTDIRNYALYGCREMHTLRLHDGIARWGGGSIMNCRSLKRLHLTRGSEKQGESLAYLCGEIHDELDVSIYGTGGTLTRLIFPDFVESYEENCPNHHFDYRISGGGYAYHHIFPGNRLDLRSYDELWSKYLKERHETECAIRLAYYRLRYPTELTDTAQVQYTAYLHENARDTLLWQIGTHDAAGTAMLLDALNPDSDTIHAACDSARNTGSTEALALLLERQRGAHPRGFDIDFDL